MSGKRWNSFCVVGLGGHARTKLLPALAANGQALAAVVSRSLAPAPGAVPKFNDVTAAMKSLTPEIVFLLSSPPALHFEQARPLLEAGRDLIVEKPAFATARQAADASALAMKSGSVLAEAFMHRQTELHRRLLAAWHEHEGCFDAIEIEFLIPGAPAGTFREQADIGSSLLLDVGCYAISLLIDLRLPLDSLKLAHVSAAGNPLAERYRIEGKVKGLAISADIGIGAEYSNKVVLRAPDSSMRYGPFFYGRPGVRSIEHQKRGESVIESIVEANAFERLLNVPPAAWLADQADRLQDMIEATRCLERVGRDLIDRRAAALRRSS